MADRSAVAPAAKEIMRTEDGHPRRGERGSGAADRSPPSLPVGKKLLFSLIAFGLFFALLEGGLALFGLEAGGWGEDPLVGFASNTPLFEESGSGEEVFMTTPRGRRGRAFNRQKFLERKPPGSLRIFCMGGSTTYGRPYDDRTSFPGWLRRLLPQADPDRRWEVINAGGISYASYRVTRLMEELSRYEPDLFIIYSGHNEFLEERSYGRLRDLPEIVKSASGLLSRTRTWAAMGWLRDRLRPAAAAAGEARQLLPEEVEAVLDRSAGPALYERDGGQRESVLLHFRLSLRRMTGIARQAGAQVLFVTPAANLKDFSPFKSQHTAGLTPEQQATSRRLGEAAEALMREQRWSEALTALDRALVADPEYALHHFLRGKALLGLGRLDEAEIALRRANDEDIVPLRALTSIQQAVREVARESGAALVDYVELLRAESLSRAGHAIPGEELFLDHVHPTIEGNRLLAVELVDALAELGLLAPAASWGDEAIAEVAAQVESEIDPVEHALALAHLSQVLNWAGKREDALRLARRAVESGAEEAISLSIVARQHAIEGEVARALELYGRSVLANPRNPTTRFQLALLLDGQGRLDEAAAHLFAATVIWPDNATYHRHLGSTMAKRRRLDLALSVFLKARRLEPGNRYVESMVDRLRAQLPPASVARLPTRIAVVRYPSGATRFAGQVKPGGDGRHIRHGILTEWYEDGQLMRYEEYDDGALDGASLFWQAGSWRASRRSPEPGP